MAKKLSRRQQRMSKYRFVVPPIEMKFEFMCGREMFLAQKKFWEDAFNAHLDKNKKK